MQFHGPSAEALTFALETRQAIDEGDDYGDGMEVGTDWSTYRTVIDFNIWEADGERSIQQRILDIRRAIGGTFEKNDPKKSSYDSSYAMLTQNMGTFDVRILTQRANTCVRKQVSVEMIEHPATEAYTEERPVFEWDCRALNEIAADEETVGV